MEHPSSYIYRVDTLVVITRSTKRRINSQPYQQFRRLASTPLWQFDKVFIAGVVLNGLQNFGFGNTPEVEGPALCGPSTILDLVSQTLQVEWVDPTFTIHLRLEVVFNRPYYGGVNDDKDVVPWICKTQSSSGVLHVLTGASATLRFHLALSLVRSFCQFYHSGWLDVTG